MPPDDPRRLYLLLTALAFLFGTTIGGAAMFAWLRVSIARERARLVEALALAERLIGRLPIHDTHAVSEAPHRAREEHQERTNEQPQRPRRTG